MNNPQHEFKSRRISVFGLGYIGTVTAACMARDGHQVLGVDVDASKVESIREGRSPVVEPGLDVLVAQQVQSGRLTATTDGQAAVRQSDCVLVCVGTPSRADGSIDDRALANVLREIIFAHQTARKPLDLVIRSTMLPNVLLEEIMPPLEELGREQWGDTLHLAVNPEFLRTTTAIRDFDSPPFIVVGSESSEAAQRVQGLYRQQHVPRFNTDIRTASLVKYVSNAFHALKIAFANEIGTMAASFGVSGPHLMELFCQDTQLNISRAYLRPGFAFGGSCLPKDVRALNHLAQQRAIRTPLLESILPSNDDHLERIVAELRGKQIQRVGLFGISFKAGTDDMRESPHLRLAQRLIEAGLDLKIFDPHVVIDRLVGRNRQYVEQFLPRIESCWVPDVDSLLRHAELLIQGQNACEVNGYQGEVYCLEKPFESKCSSLSS